MVTPTKGGLRGVALLFSYQILGVKIGIRIVNKKFSTS